jgi:hypothetical protein
MAFTPKAASTQRVTVGTSSVAVAVPANTSHVFVYNATPAQILYVEPGVTAAVVPVNGGASGAIPVPAGGLLIDKGMATTINLIASAAATDALVTPGHGDSCSVS